MTTSPLPTEGTNMTTITPDLHLRLLEEIVDSRRPVSIAGPQVGLSASEAHQIITDDGYPNMRAVRKVLDNLRADQDDQLEAEKIDQALADTDQVRPELPEPDNADPDPAPLELAAAEAGHGLGGARTLGQGVIATAEGPGEPGSVINWEGANYVPQPEPAPGEDRDPLYALGLTELVRRHHELQDKLTELRRHEQLDKGHAATATDWSAWWVSRAAMLVEQGKASPVAATRKIAAKLEELPGQLVAGLEADAADAERRAEVARLRARLAELEGKPAKAPASSSSSTATDNAAIREWAAANGHEVGKAGRIRAEVVEAYRKAHADA